MMACVKVVLFYESQPLWKVPLPALPVFRSADEKNRKRHNFINCEVCLQPVWSPDSSCLLLVGPIFSHVAVFHNLSNYFGEYNVITTHTTDGWRYENGTQVVINCSLPLTLISILQFGVQASKTSILEYHPQIVLENHVYTWFEM